VGTTFLILLLLALCGFIAYIGDLLGRRFGKKRLSIFGLRPKHTAIVLTIATGVLIAAVTFSVAVASVPGFREVVTEGERLSSQNRRLAGQNQALEQQAAERTRANEGLATENKALLGTNQRLEGEKGRLTTTNRRLGGQNETLKGQNAGLARDNAGLQISNRTLSGTNDKLSGENRRLQAAEKGMEKRVAALRLEASDYKRITLSYKERAYIYRKDDEIERRVIPANPPADVVREAVENLMFSGGAEARRRGPNPKLPTPKIVLVRHAQHPAELPPFQDEMKRWVVQEASRVRGVPVVVRLVANENAIVGRPIPARLEWYRNDLVFKKDQQLADFPITVPQAQPYGEALGTILTELAYFLQKEIGPIATSPKYGMIPDIDGVGKLDYPQLLPVCERVYDLGGRVRVVARARQDTLRAGKLNIYLEAEPMGRSAGAQDR
jgi:hypothetical protein